MKQVLLIFLSIFFLNLSGQNVVINEVFYNPIGSDGNSEWIEFYNPTDEIVDISGWKIEAGGGVFEEKFTFPENSLIPSEQFILVGEADVADCDYYSNLNFQNGGGLTDGIRIISENGNYTDTILYDSPNTNNLPADISNVNTFCPNVSEGNSLARIIDGVDTNSSIDFSETRILTPDSENIFPIDLAVNSLNVDNLAEKCTLYTHISNLSTQIVDNGTTRVDIFVNNLLVDSDHLGTINAQDSLYYETSFSTENLNFVFVQVEVFHEYDIDQNNNSASTSFLNGENPLILNEIMFYPKPTKPEWIEIFNRSQNEISFENICIYDGADNLLSFSGKIGAEDFVIVSQFSSNLENVYPDIDSEKIIIADDWASLNNSGDQVFLYFGQTLLDSLIYIDDDSPIQGNSLERVNPFEDENVLYLPSISAELATPTYENSVLPSNYDLIIFSDSIERINGNFIHSIQIRNNGIYPLSESTLRIFEKIDNNPEIKIYEQLVLVDEEAIIEVQTSENNENYLTYIYQIENDQDLVSANNEDYQFINNNEFPVCTNEIMYNPISEEAEWIEIRKNLLIDELDEVTLVVDSDSLNIPLNTQFTLITCTKEDSLELSSTTNCPIYYGINSLNNSGEQIQIYDPSNNLIESFFYNCDISSENGVSIERIVPTLEPSDSNWGGSKTYATPGSENSLFTEFIPSSATLTIAPKTFSPYRNEVAIVEFTLPKILNRVTIRIFDLKGRLIRKIVDQEINSANGTIIWNGKNNQNRNVNSGIYIIQMEAVSLHDEKVYQKQATCVIGH